MKSEKVGWRIFFVTVVALGAVIVSMTKSPEAVSHQVSPSDAYTRSQAAKMASLAGQKSRLEQQLAATANEMVRRNLRAHLAVIQSQYYAPTE